MKVILKRGKAAWVIERFEVEIEGAEGMSAFTNHPLMESARYSDAKTEEMGLDAAVEEIGIGLAEAMYVARQRAMRLVLLVSRGAEALQAMSRSEPTVLKFSLVEEAMMQSYALAVLDGLVIGYNARKIEEHALE